MKGDLEGMDTYSREINLTWKHMPPLLLGATLGVKFFFLSVAPIFGRFKLLKKGGEQVSCNLLFSDVHQTGDQEVAGLIPTFCKLVMN